MHFKSNYKMAEYNPVTFAKISISSASNVHYNYFAQNRCPGERADGCNTATSCDINLKFVEKYVVRVCKNISPSKLIKTILFKRSVQK